MLSATLFGLAVSGCGDDKGAVKTKRKDITPQAQPAEGPPQPQPASTRTDAALPAPAQGLKDAVANLPADPVTRKRGLDQIFDRTQPVTAGTSALGYAPAEVRAPTQAEIDAKRAVVQAAYRGDRRGQSGDAPRAGTLPGVPLPDPSSAAGDPDVRAGGGAIVAFDAYMRDVLHEPGKVFSRAFWGARRSKSGDVAQRPTRVTIHHTDGKQTMTIEESARAVKNIQDFHQGPERGWADIGYHFLVDGGGNVFEGRHADVLGAHTYAHNDGNLGIANLGNYERDQVTDAQKTTLVRLITFLALKYNIDPRQNGFIHGHHDFTQNNTDCPGKNLDRFVKGELPGLVVQDAATLLAKNGKGFVPVLITHPSA